MQQTQSPYRKQLFVCTNQREGEQTCCARRGSAALRDALKQYVKTHGLDGVVRVSQSGCQGLCEQGPNVMVFPDGYWYHHVGPDDVDAIIHAHLMPFVNSSQSEGPGLTGRTANGIEQASRGRSSPSSPVRAILFDLGNTLLPFNHLRAARGLAPYAREPGGVSGTASSRRGRHAPEALYQSFFDSPIQQEHDEGKLSGRAFYESVRQTYDLTCTYEQFVPIWNDIFWEDPEMTSLVRRLKPQCRLVGISNTNRLHFEDARRRFPVVGEVGTWVLSYEAGVRKPAPEMYRQAIAAAGVPPQEIVYVDDRLDLVEAGRALGFQAEPFISAPRLAAQLAAVGVAL